MPSISGAMQDHAACHNRRGPAGQMPFPLRLRRSQVLRVDLPKPLRGFEVEGRLAYLLPEQGKLQARTNDQTQGVLCRYY